jgi:ferrous iron transport protein A
MAGTETVLGQLRPGVRCVVSGFRQEGPEQFRLMEMGLLPGTELRFVRCAPLGDPLEVELRGYHLSLRRSEAETILVEVM